MSSTRSLSSSNRKVLLFILPSLLLYIIFMIFPLFQSLYYSFFSWKGVGPMEYIGLKNFVKIFSDDRVIWIGFRNTAYLIILSLIVMLPISFLLANSLAKVTKGNKLFSTIFYLPNVISTVIVALMWTFILNADFGPVNEILHNLNLDSLALVWLGDPKVAIFAVIFVNTWQFIGFHMIIFFTSLLGIPSSLFEAADIDGASEFKKMIHITIPLMNEAIKINIILVTLGSLKAFDLVYAMTSGGPADSTQLLATYMYHNTFRRFSFGYGSAISMTIFILALITSLIQQKMLSKKDQIQY